MAEIKQTERAARILHIAWEYCQKDRNEFVTPGHMPRILVEMKKVAYRSTMYSKKIPSTLREPRGTFT